jgi:hypothetical protein
LIIPNVHTIEGIAVGLLSGSFIPNPLRVLKAAIVAETQVLGKKL